jgi:hypothetical protein
VVSRNAGELGCKSTRRIRQSSGTVKWERGRRGEGTGRFRLDVERKFQSLLFSSPSSSKAFGISGTALPLPEIFRGPRGSDSASARDFCGLR